MVNKETVERKLNKLKQYLGELKEFQDLSWEKYCEDFQYRRVVERLIQLIVDVAVDINSHAVVDEGNAPPRDSFDSFMQAANLGMFPLEFAKKIAPSTGQRNIIVHEYEQIDDGLIYNSIPESVEMYGEYLRCVLNFISEV